MAKTIITTVTLTVGRDERGAPIEKPPGTAVTIADDLEADSILKRFGGEEVKPGEAAAAPALRKNDQGGSGQAGKGDEAIDFDKLGLMKRADLNTFAAEHGVDHPEQYSNKEQVIDALRKATAKG